MSILTLKIKIKTLASEAKHIRHEETRLYWESGWVDEGGVEWQISAPYHSGDVRRNLYLHRTQEVAKEARAALIAYGFMRGRRYDQIEHNPRWARLEPDRAKPDWRRVADIAWSHWPFERRHELPKSHGELFARLLQWSTPELSDVEVVEVARLPAPPRQLLAA